MEKLLKDRMLQSNRKIYLIGAAFILLIMVSIGISTTGKDGNVKSVNPETHGIDYKIVQPPLPKEMNFAGEKVPLKNFEVAERIDRELIVNVYWQSSTILGLKRANRWFPVIEPVLKKYKIPDDFKYIALIESNLTNAVSSAGAVGFWQITEEVAKKYGLEVNDEVDERYSVEKSTEAACQYFQTAYNKFNSWTLAAASYNMGMNGMTKQIERQKVHNYYNLLLSEETSRYIARILVMKEIINNPNEYGYYLTKKDLYPPLKTYQIEINTPVNDWADFAMERGITYKILKYFNPWLRDTSLANKKAKTYLLEMPVKGSIEPVKEN